MIRSFNSGKSFFILLTVFLIYIFLNRFNTHGDYGYFQTVFNSISLLSWEQSINYFYKTTHDFYYNAEPLFLITLKSFSYFFSYEVFIHTNFLILLIVYSKYISTYKLNDYFLLIIFIASFYIWSLSLASEKNKIALIFFFLALTYRNSFKYFFLFYSISILLQTSMVLYYLVVFPFLISKKDLNFYIKFLSNKKKIIFIILLITPLAINSKFIVGKVIGSNIEITDAAINKVTKIESENSLFESEFLNQDENAFLKVIDFLLKKKIISKNQKLLFKDISDKILKNLNYLINFKEDIIIYNIKSISIDYVYVHIKDRQIRFIIDSQILIKLTFFYFFIFFLSRNLYLSIIHCTCIFFISGIIGFTRFPIILSIVIICLFLDNMKNKRDTKQSLFLFSLFSIFSIYKTYIMFKSLITNGNIY